MKIFNFILSSLMAIVIAMFFMVRVHAHTFDYDECMGFGEDVIRFTIHRDRGMPEAVVQHTIQAIMAQTAGNPESYVQDAEDAHLLLVSISWVYANPSVSAGGAFDHFYDICTAKLPKHNENINPKVTPKGPQIDS